MAVRRESEFAASFNFLVSGGAAKFFSERHGNGFGVDEAASKVEIFAHACRVDLKFWRECGEVMQRAGSETHDFGQRFPFGVTGAEAALVILRLNGKDGGDKAGNLDSGSENRGASDGILFVRHGGGAAAARQLGLSEFLYFRLHVKGKVVSDFVERAGEQTESGGDFPDTVTVRMPWGARERKQQFFGEIFCDG